MALPLRQQALRLLGGLASTSAPRQAVLLPAVAATRRSLTTSTTAAASWTRLPGSGLAPSQGPSLFGLAQLAIRQQRSLSLTARLRLPVLRKAASEAPQDVARQVALFKELLDNPSTGSHDEIVGRFEELSAFWAGDQLATPPEEGEVAPSAPLDHPVLRSDDAFKLYLRALASLAASSTEPATAFAKLQAAPSRRAALIDAFAIGTSSPVPPAPAPEPQPAAASTASTATAAPQQPPLSPAALMTALFSGKSGGGDAKVVSSGSYGAWSRLGFGGSSGAKAASGSSGSVEPIRVVVEEAKSPILFRIARFLFMAAIYSFIILSLFSLLLDSTGVLRATQAAQPFVPTPPPNPADPTGRGVSFKDVHGCDEAKEELFEVVEFLKDPTRFEKLGGRLPRGLLLTGPPGTGKTLLARAIAGEAGVNVFTVSGSEFDEMYVGVGARRVRELFAAAKKAAPAIIFIDELDAVGGKRSARDQQYIKQTLNQLLVELDGFNTADGIILIGATNFPEMLDKALIRPGRFDRHIVVPLPDVRGRAQILKHHMTVVDYDKDAVDVLTIARGTVGFSGADLQALVNQAAVRASAENASLVQPRHFEWAKERIIMGAARTSAIITDKDKLATAYHEGGHALVALYTPGAYPLQSVTVIPRGRALGYTLMLPEADKNSHTLIEYRAKLDVAMGGRVAEALIYGDDNVTDGASSDIENATSVASTMVRQLGFSDVIGPVSHNPDSEWKPSPQTQAAIEKEVRTLIETAQARATALLTEKKVELDRLAQALVEYETLDIDEVKKVVRGEKLTRPIVTGL